MRMIRQEEHIPLKTRFDTEAKGNTEEAYMTVLSLAPLRTAIYPLFPDSVLAIYSSMFVRKIFLVYQGKAFAEKQQYVYVVGQNDIQVKMILTQFDSQIPLSSNPKGLRDKGISF